MIQLQTSVHILPLPHTFSIQVSQFYDLFHFLEVEDLLEMDFLAADKALKILVVTSHHSGIDSSQVIELPMLAKFASYWTIYQLIYAINLLLSFQFVVKRYGLMLVDNRGMVPTLLFLASFYIHLKVMVSTESLSIRLTTLKLQSKRIIFEVIVHVLLISIHKVVQKHLLKHILAVQLHLFFIIHNLVSAKRTFKHLLKGLHRISFKMHTVQVMIDLPLEDGASSSVNHRDRLTLCAIQQTIFVDASSKTEVEGLCKEITYVLGIFGKKRMEEGQ